MFCRSFGSICRVFLSRETTLHLHHSGGLLPPWTTATGELSLPIVVTTWKQGRGLQTSPLEAVVGLHVLRLAWS